MDFGHGTISEGEQASSIGAAMPLARDRTGKLPAGAHGSIILGFATLSHSNLKSYAKIEAAQGHNTRALETPNARKDAPAPIELLDEKSGTFVERVKAILREHGQPAQDGKPARPVMPRKGGTIACEDVYGASPEYWNRNGDWKLKPVEEVRNDPVVQAALALARKKHGPRLVSCSLHLDEESPHIHIVSVPLVRRAHAKRGKKPKGTPRDADGNFLDPRPLVEKWSLDVSSIRGLSSQLEKNHDEWAEVCNSFGLVRGARGSDMTKEQRRARRNRQTGRSSKAEMEARQERERLHEEAERSRSREADYEAEAEAKAAAAETDRAVARQERQEAEALAVRARAQEAENDQIRSDLRDREAKLKSREEELGRRAAALSREAGIHNDQVRLIARALTIPDTVHFREVNGGIELDGDLDERDREAVGGSWDWLTGGLVHLARHLIGLRDREATATERLRKANAELEAASAAKERLGEDRLAFRMEAGAHRMRIGILQKVLDPAATTQLVMKDGKLTVLGLSEDDMIRVDQGPGWFRAAFGGFVKKLYELGKGQAEVRAREKAIGLREADVAKLEDERTSLADQRVKFEKKQSAWSSTLDRARAFQIAWDGIPPDERAPEIADAIEKAKGLTTDDLPPGFNLPGRGGQSR